MFLHIAPSAVDSVETWRTYADRLRSEPAGTLRDGELAYAERMIARLEAEAASDPVAA